MIRPLIACAAVAVAAVTLAQPAGAAAVRYAYATQDGNSIVVVNDWSRPATVTDTTTGLSAVAGPVGTYGHTPAVLPAAVPSAGCVTDTLRVVWADRYQTTIRVGVCAVGA